MAASAYEILARQRAAPELDESDLRTVVRGAAEGSWSDAQLGAFLMAAAIRGLSERETRVLTLAMLESGERWNLAAEVPALCDKHSTGGLGDKVSLLLAPLLAACGQPIAMLTGRGLGHTGGTADKLESIPGVRLELDRAECLRIVEETGIAMGLASPRIAPADRRLYALRHETATIDSLPLIIGSIVSKKLALGAAAQLFDVKTGSGAFVDRLDDAVRLAKGLVDTTAALGTPAIALVTDMSQPLGRWVGNACEMAEVWSCLAGGGPADLLELTFRIAEALTALPGRPLGPLRRDELRQAIASGAARSSCERWLAAQGADPAWLRRPHFPLAPRVLPVIAERSGVVAGFAGRAAGLALCAAGAGRLRSGAAIDHGVALEYLVRIGQPVAAGDELARLHLRERDDALAERIQACFTIGEEAAPPPLVYRTVGPGEREC
jgi:pyrimidine-nucleoside phosphorylase